jgi:serine/threonine protein kinase
MGTKMPYPVTEDVDFPKPFWDNISKDACDLIRSMLCLDPAKRISAEDVTKHKWLERWRMNDLPAMDLTALQSRLKKMRTNAIMGAITTLTAINKMRSDADWEAIHKVCPYILNPKPSTR